MPVIYAGSGLTPVPYVEINEQFNRAEDGTSLGKTYGVTLNGYLTARTPNGPWVSLDDRLDVLLKKQDDFSKLFSRNGEVLQIVGVNGLYPQSGYANVNSVTFSEGPWVDYVQYSVNLELNSFYQSDLNPSGFLITSAGDSWQIEEDSFTIMSGVVKPIYRISRNTTAQGRPRYSGAGILASGGAAWEQAKGWVLNRISSGLPDSPINTSNELGIDNTQGWNHTRTETVDVLDGNFSTTDLYIYAYNQNALEDYSISVSSSPEEANYSFSATVQGNVRGLSSVMNFPAQKLENAQAYFDSNVKPNIFSRISGFVPNGYNLSPYGVNGNVDINQIEGSLSYTYEYNDRPSYDGGLVYDNWTTNKTTSFDQYETVIQLEGTILGRLAVNEPPGANLLKFQRAYNYFENIKSSGILFDRANLTNVSGLKQSYLNSSENSNYSEGSISYSYQYNNRINDLANVEYELGIERSTSDSIITVSINGSVTGNRTSPNDGPYQRYQNALNYYSGVFKPTIFALCSGYAGPGVILNPVPVRQSEGENKLGGSVRFSFEYSTGAVPAISGVMYGNISITDSKAPQVFASFTIVGRGSSGNLLQDINTLGSWGRTLSVDLIMEPNYIGRPNIESFVSGYIPSGYKVFKNSDEETWTTIPSKRFNKNVNWIYEL